MKYSSLPKLESNFFATANKGEYVFKKVAVQVKGENLTLNALFAKPAKREGYYHDVEYPKKRVVLHFTAGNIRSDMSALTRNDYHVSVAFVIGRNGIIYQLFSSRFWSGHIGKGIGNTGNAQDKCTIGIELSNYGYLTEKNGKLETYYSRLKNAAGVPAPVDEYCSLQETAAYQKLNTAFRQQKYYASFTEEQYDSLVILLRYLTAQYNIPRKFMAEPEKFLATEAVLNFSGIVTHVNYRPDGKWDIGPAFDWQKLITGVQAKTYIAKYKPSFVVPGQFERTTDAIIVSEKELEKELPEPKSRAQENMPYDDPGFTLLMKAKRGRPAKRKD